ncbi:DNA repair protein XRCC1 [Dendroctonus ponderosae]|uniref:DNA repair protein XRCC1-like n=1 Tax=Dendroctonus ponderosae TaxID=77166 RepID=UPI0020353973|nr:DNA repair protein XRCC1-like [Dendroctonus ponderosae]XP_048526057.1 DNA repair protein XRCC1 [Dendroctonus ponderosae]
MPQIKIDRVLSFTSEDANHVASNIISKDTTKKWKCKTAGEQSASVVLQLDQPYIINGIDIGNENSGYVEVLVSRASTPEDFKVLLVMSSFMSPLDARQTQNVNKVRMFKNQDLCEPERSEKWDRVKIVCTQPFNRHVQYGLSFINLYSPDGKADNKPELLTIGKFVIRPQSPDDFTAGTIFARRKQPTETLAEVLKGAAAIREATSLAQNGSPVPKEKLSHKLQITPNPQSNKARHLTDDAGEETGTPKKGKERNRNELLYSKDEEDKHEKIDKLIEKRDKERAESKKREKEMAEKTKNTPAKPKETKNNDKKKPHTPRKDVSTEKQAKVNEKRPESEKRDSLKRKHDSPPAHKLKKLKQQPVGKPFEKLLKDVILVISGIQNPERASLRSMALSMGAKYKADWDNSCTHLMYLFFTYMALILRESFGFSCAFANTPKFNQVRGIGKIVKKKWLDDCYNERKKLPWRRYALDKADKGPESEEEICEKQDTSSSEAEQPDAIHVDSDDDVMERGSDTDERIAEIQRKQADSKATDIFSLDTDSDSPDETPKGDLEIKHKLKDFFEDKLFYVDEALEDSLAKKIKQHVAAYNGILIEDLVSSIDIIVTNKENCKVLKDILPSATCVAPDWIWECHNRQMLVPMKDFIFQ